MPPANAFGAESAFVVASAPAREYPVLTSAADPTSEAFKRNDAAHRDQVADLHARLLATARGGPAPSRPRHRDRGQPAPRERVDHLLDPASPFLELSPLAAVDMYGDE